MKDFLDTALIVFTCLLFFVCMMFFAKEITIKEETQNLRNRVIEIIEINNGYTEEAKSEVLELTSSLKNDVNVIVSKEGKLDYGEEVNIVIEVAYKRKLPFCEEEDVSYVVIGKYYNVNVE